MDKKKKAIKVIKPSDETMPILAEAFLKMDNSAAKEKIPKEILEAAKRKSLSFYLPKGSVEPKLIRLKDERDGYEIILPENAGMAKQGEKLVKLDISEVLKGIKLGVNTEPNIPAWIDYNIHPKIITDRVKLMRRINGKLIEEKYGVFGNDDRQVYYPNGYPWHCIGRVFVWSDATQPNPSWSGSAVLIGDRTILTAGHVIPWTSNNWSMKFIPAYWDGSSTLGMGAESWVTQGYGYNTNNNVSAWDMAVCRLEKPLGHYYGYYGAKVYNSAWEGGNYWTIAGYPGAVAGANRPSRQMWFPVVDDDTDGSATEIEYYADSTGGNSGGPTFGFWPDGFPYVIGTVSGGSKTEFIVVLEDVNVSAGGEAMVNIIRWARSNCPL
jgi:V8-like Glu-specific endopeptidase